jgi:spore maturation protein CgeB
LVAALGDYRRSNTACRILFHDTHHRSATDPESMARYDLSAYDGVLAFGQVIRDIYLRNGWAKRAWVFHEAADVRVFQPMRRPPTLRDLVWIGNWGDGERCAELKEFLLTPVRSLRLSADVFGVRYPDDAVESLERGGIRYGGWVANFRVPEQFSCHRVTVHIPRRPYAQALPGIPTIRPFEALACGIPLVSAPWQDCESLFTPGRDFLFAHDGDEMKFRLRSVLEHTSLADSLADHGRRTVLKRHTCTHRAGELLEICRELDMDTSPQPGWERQIDAVAATARMGASGGKSR